ncbi:hypothetical protein LTR37_018098 [Vermiconidia calcicola]|uniref:Uncharacterized protein n=1 Tax=Vermiconidia calcicola TaxID=1690605 RepID=A0ACC3MJH3_9PEZI|nr:hypothetical protein LTR37_018098 [Vermiconidia calcicola]
MSHPLADFPEELLLYIAEQLKDPKDRLRFRRVCKAFAAPGATAVSVQFPTLCVTASPRSVRNFKLICDHPVFRTNSREVVYVGDYNPNHHYPDADGVDPNVLWLSESDVANEIPELQDLYRHRLPSRWRELSTMRQTEFEILREGINALPRLQKQGSRMEAAIDIEESLWSPFGVPEDVQQEFEEAADFDSLQENWLALRFILDTFGEQYRSGKHLELGIRYLGVSGLFFDEHPYDFTSDKKLSMLSSAMPLLTTLELKMAQGDGLYEPSHARAFAGILNSAANLKHLDLDWPFSEKLGDCLAGEIFRVCTWPKLEELRLMRAGWLRGAKEYDEREYLVETESILAFDKQTLCNFLLRHGPGLRKLVMRNFLLGSDGLRTHVLKKNGSSPALAPLRRVFAQMHLQSIQILLDTFHKVDEVYCEELSRVNKQIKKLGQLVGVRRRGYEKLSANISATYDFGWLLTRARMEVGEVRQALRLLEC